MVAVPEIPSARPVASVRSQSAWLAYGPRSITGTTIVRPCQRIETGVPHFSVRLATPSVFLCKICPQAVRWP